MAASDGVRVQRVRIGDVELAVISAPTVPVGGLGRLTDAERAVLEHLLAGASNEAIAKARGAAVRTVANQVASLFRKLGVNSRAELAALQLDE